MVCKYFKAVLKNEYCPHKKKSVFSVPKLYLKGQFLKICYHFLKDNCKNKNTIEIVESLIYYRSIWKQGVFFIKNKL